MTRAAWLLLLGCLFMAGCVQKGQPLITDQSSSAAPPRRSDAGVLKPSQPASPKAPVVSSSGAPARPAETTSAMPQTYTVQRGETLYAIAWRFQLDHRSLAQANNIGAPYVIFPGQQLRIQGRARQPWQPPTSSASRPGTTSPASPPPARPVPRSASPSPLSDRWFWPVQEKPVREFSRVSKGMDFVLENTASVRAANSGEVVYAGNGIGGYERLVIVKHSQNLLSAYSFNGAMQVQEGQQVKAGAQLADIRNRGRTAQKLHFELRRNGEPIDPRSKLR